MTHCEYKYWDLYLHLYLKICGFIGMVIHFSCQMVSQNGSDNTESAVSWCFVFMCMYILLCLYLLIITTKY